MSDHDDDFDDDTDGDESKLVRDLRKQLKDAKKRDTENSARLEQLEAKERRSSVADLLKAAGADPEYAEFYHGEDTSPEAVNAWIQSKAKLLGVNEEADEPEESEAVRQISRASTGAPPLKVGSFEEKAQRLLAAKTPEEYKAALIATGLAGPE